MKTRIAVVVSSLLVLVACDNRGDWTGEADPQAMDIPKTEAQKATDAPEPVAPREAFAIEGLKAVESIRETEEAEKIVLTKPLEACIGASDANDCMKKTHEEMTYVEIVLEDDTGVDIQLEVQRAHEGEGMSEYVFEKDAYCESGKIVLWGIEGDYEIKITQGSGTAHFPIKIGPQAGGQYRVTTGPISDEPTVIEKLPTR